MILVVYINMCIAGMHVSSTCINYRGYKALYLLIWQLSCI